MQRTTGLHGRAADKLAPVFARPRHLCPTPRGTAPKGWRPTRSGAMNGYFSPNVVRDGLDIVSTKDTAAEEIENLRRELREERIRNALLREALQSKPDPWQPQPPESPRGDGSSSLGALAQKPQHKLLAFSGGTGFNSICAELRKYTSHVAHVLPVSDDGGSTAEIVRVLGGPAVGDIRSRCLRLADDSNDEARAVRRLLGHRLPADPAAAKAEWYGIVEGDSPLWRGLSEPYKHTVRSFLVHFHFRIVKQASAGGGGESFDFSGGSIGNFFFAGARMFFCSLDAAIFLFSRVSGIPTDSVVLPVVSTMNRFLLGAELANGQLLRGQSAISHPSSPASPSAAAAARASVDKSPGGSAEEPLPAPIKRVMYLSTEATDQLHEVFPRVNGAVAARIAEADAIVYGMGSLYSSICASLIAVGAGEAVAARECAKVLLLNGTADRETTGMGVLEVVAAVTGALNRGTGSGGGLAGRTWEGGARALPLAHPPSAYVTCILAPRGGQLAVGPHAAALTAMGISAFEVDSSRDDAGRVIFRPDALVAALRAVVDSHRAQMAEAAGWQI